MGPSTIVSTLGSAAVGKVIGKVKETWMKEGVLQVLPRGSPVE